MSGAVVQHDAVQGAVVRAVAAIAAGVPIYDERMLQDFQEPCFFVIESSVSERPDYDRYLWREHRIEVSFYPETQALTDRHSLSRWRLLLLEHLQKIHVDATISETGEVTRLPVYAQNPECRFIADHLVFYATYRIHCARSEPMVDAMQIIETHTYSNRIRS